jgi:hypothetical protein
MKRVSLLFASGVAVALVTATLASCGDDASTTADADGGTAGDASTIDGAQAIDSPADAPSPDASTTDSGSADAADAGALCPPGFTLLRDRRDCATDGGPAPGNFSSSDAAPGDVVAMSFDEDTLPCTPAVVCSPAGAATMLFSDDPESPTADGVLYADTAGPGRFRLYVYHANGGATARKFPLVVLNQNAAEGHVTIKKKGLAAPSTNYVGVGKAVAAAWLDSNLSDVVTVPAGTRVLLDAALDAEHAAQDELVHAIYDVELDAPMKISFVSLGTAEDAATVTAGLSLLADDTVHERGTFPGADISIFASSNVRTAGRLRFGDNVTEDDLPGTDATTGVARTLGGNYGVYYTFQATSASGLVLAAAPRGGDWGGVAQPAAGNGSLLLPKGTTSLASRTSAVWIGAYPAGQVTASLVSAGGSNLPVDIVVAPR